MLSRLHLVTRVKLSRSEQRNLIAHIASSKATGAERSSIGSNGNGANAIRSSLDQNTFIPRFRSWFVRRVLPRALSLILNPAVGCDAIAFQPRSDKHSPVLRSTLTFRHGVYPIDNKYLDNRSYRTWPICLGCLLQR